MESKPTVVTITGIRPDFIRMSEVFKKLDEKFNHILIHSGQHYNKMLSDVFFEELEIRKPDYNLEVGGPGKEHFHQTAELSIKVIELLRSENIKPKWIVFLGDSNTVSIAPALRKEGYAIAHIEAGMRSYDTTMLEETNRVVCDHCSDLLFVYHDNYKQKLIKEGINENRIHNVGNTIKEVITKRMVGITERSKRHGILVDIHRPENFKSKTRLQKIVEVVAELSKRLDTPVKWIDFPRTKSYLDTYGIDLAKYNFEVIPLMSFNKYTREVYDARLLVSDSGTAQEEAPMLGTPLLVPREFTERPESYIYGCSYPLSLKTTFTKSLTRYITRIKRRNLTKWLGKGKTAQKIADILYDT